MDMEIAVLSFDGALLETFAQTVRVLTTDPFFHGTDFLFGERLRCGDLYLTVEGGADTSQTPFAGQEFTADGIVDLLIVRPEVHRHGVDIPLLIRFDGILNLLGILGQDVGTDFFQIAVLIRDGAGQREIVELAETALFFQKLIPADMDVLDGFKGSIQETLPHGFLDRLGSCLELVDCHIHIRQQVAGADQADELLPDGICAGELSLHIPDRYFVGSQHHVHLIQAHTQREEVAWQISLLDFLSVVDCHINHRRYLT